MHELKPQETLLLGRWVDTTDGLKPDETCVRIEHLTNDYLELIGTDGSGWDTLYRDPSDGRLWELTFPQSDTFGGGPPTLTLVSATDVRSKYDVPLR
jgi:hypothetical protein